MSNKKTSMKNKKIRSKEANWLREMVVTRGQISRQKKKKRRNLSRVKTGEGSRDQEDEKTNRMIGQKMTVREGSREEEGECGGKKENQFSTISVEEELVCPDCGRMDQLRPNAHTHTLA